MKNKIKYKRYKIIYHKVGKKFFVFCGKCNYKYDALDEKAFQLDYCTTNYYFYCWKFCKNIFIFDPDENEKQEHVCYPIKSVYNDFKINNTLKYYTSIKNYTDKNNCFYIEYYKNLKYYMMHIYGQ
jgi:hypothetical protein